VDVAVLVVLGLVLAVVVVLVVQHTIALRRSRDDGPVLTELERREHRAAEREERLDARQAHLDERSRDLAATEVALTARQVALDRLEDDRRHVLEQAAGLTAEQARSELVAAVEHQAKRDAAVVVREIERQARAEGEALAREIVVGAIQRLATEQTTESVVSVLHLPGDDMKGRIIGREGRNIRAFEQTTGVNLIIDDTPEAVLLSCFDPVRRETARVALEALVLDGRIHPQRIEDAYEKACGEVEARCQRAAEDAVVEVGITDLHPELVTLLGRLHYRTSYGQNVLKHVLESAHLAGLMAAELGLDPVPVRRAALLHDIGKALTHEVEGSHAAVGADVARRCGEHEDVVHAIAAHHDEVEPHTLEAVLVQAADAISGGRPGARRESLESYVTRLQRLEQIALGHEGVDKVYAMQAGREVRVMVLPDSRRRHPGAGAGPRDRQAGRARADLSRPDPGHRRARVPGHRGRSLTVGSNGEELLRPPDASSSRCRHPAVCSRADSAHDGAARSGRRPAPRVRAGPRRTGRPGRGGLDLGPVRGGHQPGQGPAGPRGRPRRQPAAGPDAQQPGYHHGDQNWLGLGAGAWDGEHRPSWVRLDRVIDVPEDGIRREGAVLDRSRFGNVAAVLRRDHGWR
jgi:ribonuclease Y